MTFELYPFQKDAVEFFRGKDFGLLADSMGLGKTVTTLSEIRDWFLQGTTAPPKVLIVCPNSVKGVWADHIEQMFPEATPLTVVRSDHRDEDIAGFDWGFLVVHWEALRLSPRLIATSWDWIVADEIHWAKNRQALRTKALKKLRTTYKRALSGTPMVNRPDELWSILNWLDPSNFKSYWRFYESFCSYRIAPQGYREFKGPKNIPKLRATMAPFTMRRTKEEVLPDLPEKFYQSIRVPLHPGQRKAYDQMRERSLAWIGEHVDEPVPAPSVLAQLTRLRQFSTAYAELDDDGKVRMSEPSSKIDALMEILEESEGPVVVFSQFRQAIDLVAERLQRRGTEFGMLHGGVPSEDRAKIVSDFQEGLLPVFLSTIQTGGTGITLHRASTVVFLDRSWSPADNLQAEDRLHRIGQKSAVQVIVLEAEGTVDQVVTERLELKWSWFRRILGG